MSTPYNTERLRRIAANPTPDALAELPTIALSIEAAIAWYERELDCIFQAARAHDYRARTVAELARLTEPQS